MAVLVLVGPDRLGEVFKVDLVADAGAGRHHAEVVEGVLAPFQEHITFHVPFVFAVHVGLKRAGGAEFVDHHRMVDHQIHRVQRVDLLGNAAKAKDAVAHRGKVHHRRNAGEILHQHAGGAVGNLARVLAAKRSPFSEGTDVVEGDGLAILEPQHVFKHHFQRGGQPGKITQARSLRRRNGVIADGLAPGGENFAGLGAVLSDGDGHHLLLKAGWPGSAKGTGGLQGNRSRFGSNVYHGMPKHQTRDGDAVFHSRM